MRKTSVIGLDRFSHLLTNSWFEEGYLTTLEKAKYQGIFGYFLQGKDTIL